MSGFEIWWKDRQVEAEISIGKKVVVDENGNETEEHIKKKLVFVIDCPSSLDALKLRRCRFALSLFEGQVTSSLESLQITAAAVFSELQATVDKARSTDESAASLMERVNPLQFNIVEKYQEVSGYAESGVAIRSQAIGLVCQYIKSIRYHAPGLPLQEEVPFNGKKWSEMDRAEKEEVADHFAGSFLGTIAEVLSRGADIETKKK